MEMLTTLLAGLNALRYGFGSYSRPFRQRRIRLWRKRREFIPPKTFFLNKHLHFDRYSLKTKSKLFSADVKNQSEKFSLNINKKMTKVN
jgi:hypothetical protein